MKGGIAVGRSGIGSGNIVVQYLYTVGIIKIKRHVIEVLDGVTAEGIVLGGS